MGKAITLKNIKDIMIVPDKQPKNENERNQYLQKYGKNLKMLKEIKKAIALKEKDLETYVKDNLLDKGEKLFIGEREEQISISLSNPKNFSILDIERFKTEKPETFIKYLEEKCERIFNEEKFFNEDREIFDKYLIMKEKKATISFSKKDLLQLGSVKEEG